MIVKNYYALPLEEVQASVDYMREWFWFHQGSEHWDRVRFALSVAFNALEIVPELEKDQFLRLVVEIICPPPAT